MSKKKISFLLIAVLGIALLVFLYRFVAEYISVDNTGTAYKVEQGVKAGIVVLIAWLISRFIDLFYWKPLEKKRGRPVFRALQDLIILLILIIAALFILIVIYGKSIEGAGTMLGGSVMGFSFIAKDIAVDYIYGIILDFSGDFKEGDWIKLPNGVCAQIIEINLREMALRMANDNIIRVNNSDIMKGNVINYSDSKEGYWGEIVVSLDRTIPISRAKRLLQAAVSAAPLVANKQASVGAIAAENGEISYKIRFKIGEFSQTPQVQHNVIQSVMKHLVDHKLNITSSSTYVYHWKEEFDAPNTVPLTPAFEALRLSPLFSECDDSDLEKIASVVKVKTYAPGDIIIAEKTRGTVMYFLAEGIVEISIQIKVAEEGVDGMEEISSKKHITFLTTNDFFGEGGVLYDSPRNATCSAYTEAVLYELEREDLKRVLKELPDVVVKISEAMVARRQETASIADKAKQTLEDRKKQTDEFASALRSFLGL